MVSLDLNLNIFSGTIAFHAVITEFLTIEYDTTVIIRDVLTNNGDG